MCECASVCLSMHSRSVWLAMCMGRQPICVGLSMGSMREKGVWMRVCARTNAKALSESNERVGKCVWETERGTRSCKVKSLPVHVTSWWRERSPPSFSPSVLRSFVLDVFPGNAAVVSTLPKSHSHRLPLPSPKAGWEKICHLHHCGISALYGLSKSGSAEREGFETEKVWRWGLRVQFNETFPIFLLLHCWCLCRIINDSRGFLFLVSFLCLSCLSKKVMLPTGAPFRWFP